MTGGASAKGFAYGPVGAPRWDANFGSTPATASAVQALAHLAAGRPILEFGIGTGRLALPLRKLGLDVAGIDDSPWMLAELQRKPGTDEIAVTLGDCATTRVDGQYGLVVIADYTLQALGDQEAQVQCFANAAAHLELGGVFVLEVVSPHVRLLENGRCVTTGIDSGEITLFVSHSDPITQRMQLCYLTLKDGEPPTVTPSTSRYVWPSELDLMARMAGMKLHARWSGWERQPFTAQSPAHISVYERSVA